MQGGESEDPHKSQLAGGIAKLPISKNGPRVVCIWGIINSLPTESGEMALGFRVAMWPSSEIMS